MEITLVVRWSESIHDGLVGPGHQEGLGAELALEGVVTLCWTKWDERT